MERFTMRQQGGELKKLGKELGIADGMPFLLAEPGADLRAWAESLGIDVTQYLTEREIKDAPLMSFDAVVNRFLLSVCSGSRSPHTWLAAAQHLATYLSFLEGRRVDWWQASKKHISEFHRLRVLSPAEGQKPLRESSWNACIGVVTRFYAWAVEEQIIERSPIGKRVRRFQDRMVEKHDFTERVPPEPVRFVTLDQYREFRKALMRGQASAGRNGLRNIAFADSLLSTGMRVNEACGLRVSLLPDPLSPQYTSKRTLPLSVVGKGRKRRQVQLSRRARQAIDMYVADERAAAVERLRRRVAQSDPEWLWLTERGTKMTSQRWEEIFSEASSESGIKCTPHFLRHTFAIYTLSEMLRLTIGSLSEVQGRQREYAKVIQNPLRQLQRLLGHSSIASTYIYLDVIEEHAAVVDEAIDQWTQEAFLDKGSD